MRQTLPLALLFVFSVLPAWSDDVPDWPKQPLFVASDFHFSQVDTVCLAPVVDLKPEVAEPLMLHGPKPARPPALARFMGAVSFSTADTDLAEMFQHLGYSTVNCQPVSGTADDLKMPLSDAWINKLDFGQSRFLFLVGVEDRSTASRHGVGKITGQTAEAGWAVVSAYLFDKQAPGKLVWRDRVLGIDASGMTLTGPEAAAKAYTGEKAVSNGELQLLSWFGNRNPKAKQPSPGELKAHSTWGRLFNRAETYDVPCTALWSAVKNTLGSTPKYEIMATYESDLMVFFLVGRRPVGWTYDFLTLKPGATGCTEHFVQTQPDPRPHDARNLNKLVHAALAD